MGNQNLDINHSAKNHQVINNSIDLAYIGIVIRELSWSPPRFRHFLVDSKSGEKFALDRAKVRFLSKCHFFYGEGSNAVSVVVDVNASEEQLDLVRQVVEILEKLALETSIAESRKAKLSL